MGNSPELAEASRFLEAQVTRDVAGWWRMAMLSTPPW